MKICRLHLCMTVFSLLLLGQAGATEAPAVLLDQVEQLIGKDNPLAYRHLESALAGLPEKGALRLRAEMLRCQLDLDSGAEEKTYQLATQALQAHGPNDQTRIALQICAGKVAQQLAKLDLAAQHFEGAVESAKAIRQALPLADALSARGTLYIYRGESSKALDDLLEASRLFTEAGKTTPASYALSALANLYSNMGEYDNALRYHRQLLDFYKQQARPLDQAVSQFNIANVYSNMGNVQEARKQYQLAIEVAQRANDSRTVAYAERALGSDYLAENKPAESLRHLARAKAFFDKEPDEEQRAITVMAYAKALRLLKRSEQALREIDLALQVFDRNKSLYYQIGANQERSYILASMGSWQEAFVDFDKFWGLHLQWDRRSNEQRTAQLRTRFDVQLRDQENQRIALEKKALEESLHNTQQIRRLQLAVLLLAALVLCWLSWFAIRQIGHARRMKLLALSDELTGLSNRRSIMAQADGIFKSARKLRRPASVVIFDIDFFKRINDEFGHACGDAVLVAVSSSCQSALRRGDSVGRIGGEEFLVLLPEADIHAAQKVAECLRKKVESIDLKGQGIARAVTISLGVAQIKAGDKNLASLIERADQALYRAKDGGRNRVELDQAQT